MTHISFATELAGYRSGLSYAGIHGSKAIQHPRNDGKTSTAKAFAPNTQYNSHLSPYGLRIIIESSADTPLSSHP